MVDNGMYGNQEYTICRSSFCNEHVEYFYRFLELYPFLLPKGMDSKEYRTMAEAFSKLGFLVYEGFDPISPMFRDNFFGFDFSAGVYIPTKITDFQKDKFEEKLEELGTMYLELARYTGEKIEYYLSAEDGKYVAFQKLKTILKE